jgi:hypothetical protein
MFKTIVAVAAIGSLAACAKPSASEDNADMLENAADQSTPEAAEALRNSAEQMRDQDQSGAPADPNGPIQNAMERAGDAQTPPPAAS